MLSGFLLFILTFSTIASEEMSNLTASVNGIEPLIYSDKGVKLLQLWHKLQNIENRSVPYDSKSCYGWIGERHPRRGEYIGITLTPNCYVIQADLIDFEDVMTQMFHRYNRFTRDSSSNYNRCMHHIIFVGRLHRIDEGGRFTYHYTRVRLIGNKVQVTFYSLKDQVSASEFYNMSDDLYDVPSFHFYTQKPIFPGDRRIAMYTINHELHGWFKTPDGLKLYHYRFTWDGGATGNGYSIDTFKVYIIPELILPSDNVNYVITSDEEVHYFLVSTDKKGLHKLYILKHIDLISGDFSGLETIMLDLAVDVIPRYIIGDILSFYGFHKEMGMTQAYRKSHNPYRECPQANNVVFYRNETVDEDGEKISLIPEITDPPLALNIFAVHFRSAYPFVQSGRSRARPSFQALITPIYCLLFAAGFTRWWLLGYSVLPTSLARKFRLMWSSRRTHIFKRLAMRKRSKYATLFLFIYRLELFVRYLLGQIYKKARWAVAIEATPVYEGEVVVNDRETHGSAREMTTPTLDK